MDKNRNFTYVILKNNEVYAVTHYLKAVEEYTNILSNTISRYFYRNKEAKSYKKGEFEIVKCTKVNFKGNYKANFH